MAMEATQAVFRVFRAVSLAALVRSASLAPAVTGGVLRSTMHPVPGTATWITTLALYSGPTTLREMVSLSVASGIDKNATKIVIRKIKALMKFFAKFPNLFLWVLLFLLSACKKGSGAICRDGTRSYSTGRGTCSWHGGIDHYVDPNEIDEVRTVILVVVIVIGILIYRAYQRDK